MDLTLAILGMALVLIGFVGSILPIIPGPPISWAGFLLLKWTDYVNKGATGYENTLWVLLFVVVLVTILDYVVPILGTKKYGGSKRGVWGATIGVVVGLFFRLGVFRRLSFGGWSQADDLWKHLVLFRTALVFLMSRPT